MTTFVKICGMTDREAVQAAVAAEVDAIGFVFYAGSPRNVSANQATILATGIPAHIRRVAVMLHPNTALWREVESEFRPDVLQTDLADLRYLEVAAGIETWPVVREGALDDEFAPVDTYVYEGRKSGAGAKVDWAVAASIAKQGRMILAGGLNPRNVTAAIRQVKPFGVDVSSAVESQPGKKDAAMIAAFAAASKAA